MAVPDRILDWATNAGARVSAVAYELTGFRPKEAVRSGVLNDVIARLSGWGSLAQNFAWGAIGVSVWSATDIDVLNLGAVGVRLDTTATGATSAATAFVTSGFTADAASIVIFQESAGLFEADSVSHFLTAIGPQGWGNSEWRATSTGTGAVAYTLFSGSGDIHPQTLWIYAVNVSGTSGDRVSLSTITFSRS